LWDAAQEGILTLKNVQGRRLVVIFTDGKDQNEANTGPQSSHTAKDVAKMSRRQHVPLWTIGLGKEPDADLLGRLSAVTGGQFYNPSDAGDLRKTFGEVLTDVRLQYRITYGTPKEKRDGTRRIVAVTSAAKGQSGQGRIAYLAPSDSVARQTPVPVASSGQAGTRPLARVRQTPPADSTELGELLDETSTAAGAGLAVNGPGGTVDVGTGNVRVTGPRGTVNVSPGNVNVTGPHGSVDVGGIHIQTGPGGVSVDTPGASVNTGPGGVDVQEKQTQPESGSNEEPEQKE
ncbi:MAG: VWA domain-containing protein, partial [Candidatus Wallbacteria bacterium]|nr:VWA domain-containing protein [Candidatus Wallbacteria bacterium]